MERGNGRNAKGSLGDQPAAQQTVSDPEKRSYTNGPVLGVQESTVEVLFHPLARMGEEKENQKINWVHKLLIVV